MNVLSLILSAPFVRCSNEDERCNNVFVWFVVIVCVDFVVSLAYTLQVVARIEYAVFLHMRKDRVSCLPLQVLPLIQNHPISHLPYTIEYALSPSSFTGPATRRVKPFIVHDLVSNPQSGSRHSRAMVVRSHWSEYYIIIITYYIGTYNYICIYTAEELLSKHN